jgi:hypothetical protein
MMLTRNIEFLLQNSYTVTFIRNNKKSFENAFNMAFPQLKKNPWRITVERAWKNIADEYSGKQILTKNDTIESSIHFGKTPYSVIKELLDEIECASLDYIYSEHFRIDTDITKIKNIQNELVDFKNTIIREKKERIETFKSILEIVVKTILFILLIYVYVKLLIIQYNDVNNQKLLL